MPSAGGGRYRIKMAGREIDGVGFAMGIERVIMALQKGLALCPAGDEDGLDRVAWAKRAFQENVRAGPDAAPARPRAAAWTWPAAA
jgi:histidyl-tRNA synthetase